ncbi:MAG: heme-binding protein, partial [Burkholderiales bacterium]
SRQIRDRTANRAAFQNAVAAASQGRFVPVPGGVLILNDAGQAIGAVGISGDASDRDEYCAIEAIKAVGLIAEPSEPAADWKEAPL